MREILFRGKRIDNGEWIEGSLINDGRCFVAIHPSLAFGPTSKDEINGETLWGFYPFFEVDPSTTGQYTGLTDKNGKKIFEGDILSIARKSNGMGDYFYPPLKYPSNAIVEWDKCSWMWEIMAKPRYYLTFPNAWCHFECEVIGNVTDNPELLEAGE